MNVMQIGGTSRGKQELLRRFAAQQNGQQSSKPRKWFEFHVSDPPAPVSPEIAARLAKMHEHSRLEEIAALRKQERAIVAEIARRADAKPLFDGALGYRQRKRLRPETIAKIEHLQNQPAEYRPALLNMLMDWSEISQKYFAGQLDPLPEITIAEQTSLARCYRSEKARIEVAPKTLKTRAKGELSGLHGVLLHEAIHAHIAAQKLPYSPMDERTGGHGEAFTKESNRIGEILGLRPVILGRVEGDEYAPCHFPLITPKKRPSQ